MGEPRYVADAREAVVLADLGGLTALFHRPSGQTHMLASPAPELLTMLADAPADIAELTHRLSARFELAQAEALIARLAELEAAGLVRRA